MGGNPNFEEKPRPVSEASVPDPDRKVRDGPMGTPPSEPQDSRVTRVQDFALFLDISPQDCSQIVSKARDRLFSPGQVIYLEGDDMRQVVLLTSGSAKMVQCSQNGSAVSRK